MTFGAMAAWQAALLLAGAAAVAALLFRLRVRPPRILLPSLLLWRRVLDESREATWWERVRRAVSLALTIAIAVALALSLTRPSRGPGRASSATPGRTLIVLDASPSMLARTRSGETRWIRAVAEARRIAAAAADAVTIATTSDGIVEGPTADLASIDTALDIAAPGGDTAWWPAATHDDSVHFITDGAVARAIDRGVTVHSVFEPAANVAITAFDVRPSLGGATAGEAYLEVANYAPEAQSARLTIARGRITILDRRLDIRAGETLRQIVPLARGGDPAVHARVEARHDALDLDNHAVAWIERARPLAVTVVGARTAWLARLLARDPDVRATFVEPSEYRTGGEEVVVFDRWTPDGVPDRPALYFAPPLPIASEELRPTWTAAGAHPVVQGVDPFTVTIEKARAYRALPLDAIATSARGTPLVYAGEQGGRRAVVVSFSAGESNLASAPAFPVLVGNALDWLARVASAGARPPGPIAFDDRIVRVDDERGRALPLTRVNGVALGVLRTPGLYFADGGGARTAIAVNAGDPQRSNVLRTNLTSDQQARPVQSSGSRHPWWMYAAAAAFALASAEWWTWQRRITL